MLNQNILISFYMAAEMKLKLIREVMNEWLNELLLKLFIICN